jgi:hypothetical protein
MLSGYYFIHPLSANKNSNSFDIFHGSRINTCGKPVKITILNQQTNTAVKALFILLITVFLLSGIAIQKRSTAPNSCMSSQEAHEYAFRNLQPGHLQFYSPISLNTEENPIELCPEKVEQDIFASQEIAFTRQLARALNYYQSKLR